MVNDSPHAPPAASRVTGANRRLRVVQGLLAHAVTRHALAWLLLAMAASQHRLPWEGLLGLIALTIAASALLPAMARRGVPFHRFDPGLFGPLTLLSGIALFWVALMAEPADRWWLLACVLPSQLAASTHLRGPAWRHASAFVAFMAGALLLAFGLGNPLDDTLVAALTGMMAAPLLPLWSIGRLRHLRARALKKWLLSNDRAQGVFIQRFLIACLCALSGIVALEYGASVGFIDPQAARWMTYLAAVTILSFYLVTRSGLNQNLHDRTMTEPKLLVCVVFLAFGYYLGGIGRGLALTLLVTMEMFGMFMITPSQVARISAFAAVAFSVSMLAVVRNETDPGQIKLQGVTFGVMVVVLTVMSWLAQQLGLLRNSLVRRKNELSEALERIQVLATRDELTGLVNRRHMIELIDQRIKLGARSGTPACIALIDLDHFKAVNDTHGHGVGDEVLRNFARAMKAGLRDTDVVARWGGEEFLILLNDSDMAAAALGIERARLEVARTAMSATVPKLHVTFSCGLAPCEDSVPLEKLVDLADQRLYEAKAQGRNRTCAIMVPMAASHASAKPQAAVHSD
ncbi:MAG TPA: diguanylate cyclase [Candidatus Aquabacterium excrementipullorum]|nr:diguanylate cyclase [Candidatus Aquabacterium excrementipullorum]